MRRYHVEDFYQDLIGKKYQKNGRGSKGYDCYGVVLELAKRRGFFLPEIKTPESIKLRQAMFEKLSSEYAIPIEKPEPNCIVVFDTRVFGRLHVGMVLENCRQFIHADLQRVRVCRLDSFIWKRLIIGFYRLTKKLEDLEDFRKWIKN